MQKNEIVIYRYRWVILLVFALINIVVQIQWLSFASIAREARLFYDATALQIDFFSMIYMLVFLIVCIPASYVIDTYGIRIGIGIGAVLTGIFGFLKGYYAGDYMIVAVSQTGLAVAQPFVLNAATKLAGRWFPINERATAVGIATLSQFVGIVIVMIATPLMITKTASGTYDLSGALMGYGIVSVVCAVLLLVFLKEHPPTPPVPGEKDDNFAVFKGIRHIFSKKDSLVLLLIFFFGLGVFNAVSTCIDQICQVKNLSIEETGLVGGIMLIAGIIGAATVPIFSDRMKKRKPFLMVSIIGAVVGLLGLTLATSFMSALIAAFILGFFLLGICAPIGFQYGAEISHPAPESTAQGLVLLAGQISGIVFILGINRIGITPFMYFFVGLMAIGILLVHLLSESPISRQIESN
jgi:MFS family permease